MGNLTNWVLGTTERGQSCGANSTKSSRMFRVHVPKILPLVPFGSPSLTAVALNRNCFCNAANCKPSISTSVTTANFIEIPISGYNEVIDVYHKHDDYENVLSARSHLVLGHGQAIKVEALNGNVDNLQVISKI